MLREHRGGNRKIREKAVATVSWATWLEFESFCVTGINETRPCSKYVVKQKTMSFDNELDIGFEKQIKIKSNK